MPSLACDVTAFAQNPYGGIARVCCHTAIESARQTDFAVTACYLKGARPNFQNPVIQTCRLGLWSGLLGPNFDIAHSICHRKLPVKARFHVYTVHDAWSLAPNDYQSPAFQRKLGARMRRDLARVDLVTTDSHYTRSELLKYDLIDPDKCVPLPIGVTLPGAASGLEIPPSGLAAPDRPFVLFVGRLENRKNIQHILQAVSPISDLVLVLVGEPGFGYEEKIRPALGSFPAERLVHLKGLPEHQLLWLYRHALVMLQPSWDEGFGLPILEAMAAGCPVITSDRSAGAELAGDAAILVDPHAPEQSRREIERLLSDGQTRLDLIESGLSRAKGYTWERYGEQLTATYRALLQ